MMFRTHLLFALVFYLFFIKFFSFDFSIIFAIVLCFGAMLPDIDSPDSFINRKYLFGFGKGVAFFSKHRGFWHSIFGLMIFFILSFVIVYLAETSFFFVFALPGGYFSHLVADSFNKSGIKWFWKSDFGHLKGKIKTGSIFEQIFFVALFIMAIYLIIGKQGIQEITSFVARIKP